MLGKLAAGDCLQHDPSPAAVTGGTFARRDWSKVQMPSPRLWSRNTWMLTAARFPIVPRAATTASAAGGAAVAAVARAAGRRKMLCQTGKRAGPDRLAEQNIAAARPGLGSGKAGRPEGRSAGGPEGGPRGGRGEAKGGRPKEGGQRGEAKGTAVTKA